MIQGVAAEWSFSPLTDRRQGADYPFLYGFTTNNLTGNIYPIVFFNPLSNYREIKDETL